ncbi:MAG TPA: hypothetical protein VGQ69_04580 [Gemmatimonadales bacterium]|jgi:Flp pilus assembly protein TadB|nr:hypothetical protein [Gemmatimonadales bacterium]
MPADPNANAGYMIAAYVVTAVILVGYAVMLWRKRRSQESGIRGQGSGV